MTAATPAPASPPGPPRGGRVLKVVNPATGEALRELAEDTPEAIARKVEKARRDAGGVGAHAAAPSARGRSPPSRPLVEKDKDALAARLTSRDGQAHHASRATSSPRCRAASASSSTTWRTRSRTRSCTRRRPGARRITYEPLGLVGNISAWNYPYFVGSNVFVPALLAGNAVLYKPSEFATLTGLAITEAMHEAGVPAAVFAPVIGGGEAGRALVEQPLDAVFFTGSYATGRKIAEAAARRLMKVQLELGGKDPVYVADDVDVGGRGQGHRGRRLLQHRPELLLGRAHLRPRAHPRRVRGGVRRGGAGVRGRRSHGREDLHRARRARGPSARSSRSRSRTPRPRAATLRLGGARLDRPGFYFAPTVFTEARPEMALMREETFGPLIGIQKVEDDDEALRLMNDTEYGLTAGRLHGATSHARGRLLAGVNSGSRLLELLRPRQPPPALVGPAALRRRRSRSAWPASAPSSQPKAWHLKRPQ